MLRSLAQLFCLFLVSCVVVGARADAAPRRTMIIVAHHDDDLLILHPDLHDRLTPSTPVQTVYLTNGNAGLHCPEYTRGREAGSRAVHAKLVGVPNEWTDEERVIGGKHVRVSTLNGTAHSLWFLGFANSPEKGTSLEYLWDDPSRRIQTMRIDGRSAVDSYSAEELIDTLRALMDEQKPEDIRMLDGSRRQPEFYPFEHTDHVHSALFALAALERYGKSEQFVMYRAYNIQLEDKNLPEAQIAEREALFRLYAEHDMKICEDGKVDICGERVRCYPLNLFLPFMARRYTIDNQVHDDSALFTKFGRCMKVKNADGDARVTMKRCGDDDPSYHWSLDPRGQVRHRASGKCLTARARELGSSLTLAPCKDDVLQRFFLNTQGQLRGPEASCVRSGLRDPVLQKCARRIRQTNWRVGERRR